MNPEVLVERIVDGRTDLVWDYIAQGHPATSETADGVPLVRWCAYYGDVSAIRFLFDRGETLTSLGENLGLHGAAFHGHWQLCEFLIELGADVNGEAEDTGETPLHAALCTPQRAAHDLVLRVLLGRGGDPHRVTRPGAATGAFMRDCRTKGETPLHRAAAFGSEDSIDLLIGSGAARDAKDMNGDTPLCWASWYVRPDSILRRLCYGSFSIHPDRQQMQVALLGKPHSGL